MARGFNYSASESTGTFVQTPTDEPRIKAYEAKGMTRENAQSAVETENQSWKDGKPPLGANEFTPNPSAQFPAVTGARAFLADEKSTQEIKRMIVSDFKSEEASKFGIRKVINSTNTGNRIKIGLATNLDPSSTNFKQDFAKVYNDAKRIASAYNVDSSNKFIKQSRYYTTIVLSDKNGLPIFSNKS